MVSRIRSFVSRITRRGSSSSSKSSSSSSGTQQSIPPSSGGIQSSPTGTVTSRPSGGGSSGGQSVPPEFGGTQTTIAADRAVAASRATAQKRAEQIQKENQEKLRRESALRRERTRIEALRRDLERRNAQINVQNLIDAKTRDRIRTETIIDPRTNERIFIRTNLDTGETSTRTFQKDSSGRRVVESGVLVTRGDRRQEDVRFFEEVAKLQQGIKLNLQARNVIDRINRLGATTPKREAKLKLNILNKERDLILNEIDRINSKYPSELNEEQFSNYKKEIAPVVARYNVYNNVKGETLKKFPDEDLKATSQINPLTGVKELVLDKKDTSLSRKVSSAVDKATTTISRGKGDVKTEAKLSALVSAQAGIEAVKGFALLPKTITSVIKDPRILKQLPSAIKKSGEDFGVLARVSPTAALVKFGTNVYLIKSSDKALRGLSRLSSGAFVRLNPKYVGKLQTGKSLAVNVGKGRKANLKVVGKIPSKAIPKQVELAGKRVTAVSTQADALVGFLKRRRLVRKPLGAEVEKALGKRAVRLLRKYDSGGGLTRKEISFLDSKIRNAGSKGLLERSFFADPTGKVRPSRLGLQDQKPLRIMDYLTEDITFRRPNPQILVFDNVLVQKFPKSLAPIVKKLKSGKALTEAEASKLLSFQIRKSGKFKPLGFRSAESEITIPSGEIIRRVRKIGVTRIKGRNIPIVQAEIFRPTKALKDTINKFKRGKLNPREVRRLENSLERRTGLKYDLSSRKALSKRYVPIRRIGLSTLSTSLRRASRTRLSRRVLSPKARSGRSSGKKSSPRRSPKRPTSPIRKSPIKSPPKRIPKSPIKGTPSRPIPKKILSPSKLPEGFKRRTVKNALKGYYVAIKRQGKIVNLNARPLTLSDARDYLAYRLDRGLGRTAFFVPIGQTKQIVSLPSNIKGYFNKNRRKLRPYKIRQGKKKAILRGYIEKKKFVGDTKSEIAELKASRKSSRRSASGRRNVRFRESTSITPARRRQLLQQLKKARMIRQQRIKSSPKVIKRTTPKKVMSPARRRELLRNLAKARKARFAPKKIIKRTPTTKKNVQSTKKNGITPQQRKVLLERLKKARAVRMANLKRK